ncbi:JAB domain-containing protein [Leptobacterium sp. I13]|uniref:JAB domain-containing protein n=1 Tax=Leptobacterium meishanense TaxID=3128904 RepID=UPI0030ECD8D2
MQKVSEINVSYSAGSNDNISIKNSDDAYNLVLADWNNNTIEFQEEVKVLLLNRANRVLGIYDLSKGGVSGTVVDIKIVLSVALKCHASNIILVHNHPSGNLKPSSNDISLTKRLKKACGYVDIVMLDHLIISKEGFYSFKDKEEL